MTNLTYTLSNGTVVSSYREAVASGLSYKATYTAVSEMPNNPGGKYVGKAYKYKKFYGKAKS